jgi:hypothetical protein
MELNINTTTAWTPSFGMPTTGYRCAFDRALGAALVPAAQGRSVVAIARVKGAFPGSPAWRPPIS